jgi:4-cresol dehydrogenase (hydroxylating)
MSINQAIDDWKEILQDNIIVNPPRLKDVGSFKDREVPAFLYPHSIEEIKTILKIANTYKVPLHPISRGKNWGLGSKKPVKDNVSIMFLDKIDQIIEVNEKFQYAIIEPGVTQGQLSEYLLANHPSLIINIGGGGKSTSIIGNFLERGSGVYGVRNIQDILAMEVVLPNGELIHTGFWNTSLNHSSAPFIHTCSEGLGPDVRGLFVQSNLGIITKMVVKLRRYSHPLTVNIMTDDLVELIETLRVFKANGYLEPGVNIFDFSREQVYYQIDNLPTFRWMAVANVFGTELVREAVKISIENYLKTKIGFQLEFFDSQIPNSLQHNIGNWVKHSKGVVTDDNIRGMYSAAQVLFKENFDLDEDFDSIGFIVLSAASPCDGMQVQKAVKAADEIATLYGIMYGDFGLSDLKEFSLKMHWAFVFDKNDPAQVSQIHKCKNHLVDRLFSIGIFPQRLDIDSMERMESQNHHSYSDLLYKLKSALDANHIISPGRYIKDVAS